MGWREKQLEKHRMHKLLEQALNSPEYKEERRKWEEQAVLQSFLRFVFIGMVYIEMNFRCKRNGLLKFLEFAKKEMAAIGNDEEYFNDANKYYKENFDIDVMGFMGMALVKKGDGNETN